MKKKALNVSKQNAENAGTPSNAKMKKTRSE